MQLDADHLDTCVQCAQEQRLEVRVLDSIKAKLRQLEVPDLLLKRISKALEDERKRAG